jgi:hypothetical protein
LGAHGAAVPLPENNRPESIRRHSTMADELRDELAARAAIIDPMIELLEFHRIVHQLDGLQPWSTVHEYFSLRREFRRNPLHIATSCQELVSLRASHRCAFLFLKKKFFLRLSHIFCRRETHRPCTRPSLRSLLMRSTSNCQDSGPLSLLPHRPLFIQSHTM